MGKPKVYCEQCKHYSRGKRNEVCAKAVDVVQRGTATYAHPERVRRELCWEKNERNNCPDYESKRISRNRS